MSYSSESSGRVMGGGGRETWNSAAIFFTACKRSLRRLCFYRCLSVHGGGGGVVSQHALQVVSQHALQQGEVSQHALQVVSQHALQQGGGSTGPHPGGSWGVWPGWAPCPHPGVSRPTHRGCISQHALRQTPPPPPPVDGYCRRRYASYWNAFLLWLIFTGSGGHAPLAPPPDPLPDESSGCGGGGGEPKINWPSVGDHSQIKQLP